MQCTHTIYIGGGGVYKGRGGGRRTKFKATDDRCSVHTLEAGVRQNGADHVKCIALYSTHTFLSKRPLSYP